MSTSMYEVFHWDSQPAKPRLSLAPQTDPSLSVVDAPVSQSVPQTPVHPKPFVASRGGEFLHLILFFRYSWSLVRLASIYFVAYFYKSIFSNLLVLLLDLITNMQGKMCCLM